MNLPTMVAEYWHSRPRAWGAKVIMVSLILLCGCAAPFMIYMMYVDQNHVPVALSYLLIAGSLIAHVGFFIGIIHLMWEMFSRRNSRDI